MKRWRLWIFLVIGVAALALAVRHVRRVRLRQERDAHNREALRKYSQNLKPGSTRTIVKDYLRAQGTMFGERCCETGFHAYSVIVKVGDEDVPWFCSGWPVYVAFEFEVREPYNLPLPVNSDVRKKIEQHELEMFPGDSDVLQKVQLVSNGEGCL
jgi:hypothetical protein